jgi:hypothetical protein
MELFIQIRDGQPFEHPILGENFKTAFPNIDVNNLPPEFARFERVVEPIANVFEVVAGSHYEWVGDVVKDVWTLRPMTAEEEAVKRQDLTTGAYFVLNWRKETTQEKINTAPSEEIKQVWVNYLAELNAWVLVDPVNPGIPTPPVVSQSGQILTTSASGSSPDVLV